MVKEQSLSSLIKSCDEAFSEFIRLRDAKPFSGLVHCFICGVAIPWRSSQAMHYIDRDQMAVRFDQMNVNAGCQVCNCMDDDHRDKYRNKLIISYGIAEVQRLEFSFRSLRKFMRIELYELWVVYKEKVKELRKQKHL